MMSFVFAPPARPALIPRQPSAPSSARRVVEHLRRVLSPRLSSPQRVLGPARAEIRGHPRSVQLRRRRSTSFISVLITSSSSMPIPSSFCIVRASSLPRPAVFKLVDHPRPVQLRRRKSTSFISSILPRPSSGVQSPGPLLSQLGPPPSMAVTVQPKRVPVWCGKAVSVPALPVRCVLVRIGVHPRPDLSVLAGPLTHP